VSARTAGSIDLEGGVGAAMVAWLVGPAQATCAAVAARVVGAPYISDGRWTPDT
jgi:hypothetical protein